MLLLLEGGSVMALLAAVEAKDGRLSTWKQDGSYSSCWNENESRFTTFLFYYHAPFTIFLPQLPGIGNGHFQSGTATFRTHLFNLLDNAHAFHYLAKDHVLAVFDVNNTEGEG